MDIITETFVNEWFCATFRWEDGLLAGIDLSAQRGEPTAPRSAYGQALSDIIEKYALLDSDVWPDLPLNWSRVTPFARNVLETLRRQTPRGTCTTYGSLAAICGSPRAARAVGGVMARNPWPLVIPCHRVLAGNNGIGGFGPGVGLKRSLLTLERALLSD